MQRKKPAQAPSNWDDVHLFLTLCRSRTLGEAARVLAIDSSTVSRRLVALEEALTATLFDRGREGIVATKAAEDLLPVAEEMESTMNRFANAVDGLEREVSGLVRITCSPDVADVVVAPLLGELLSRHPSLRVELDPGEAVLDLTRREADIALRIVRPTRGDLIVLRVASVRWLPVAAPKVAQELGSLRKWRDAGWVGWGERLSHIGPARWLAARLEDAVPLVRSDSLLAQLAVLAAGVGVGLVPEPSARHYGLVPVKLSAALRAEAGDWPDNDLFIVTHRALRDVPRVRAVWDLIVERTASRFAVGFSGPA